MDIANKTAIKYGFLWTRKENDLPVNCWHFNAMQEVITEPIVRGNMGIDIGSGSGYDTYIMAKNNPSTKIVSIDISDGIYYTKNLTSGLNNVQVIKSSVLDIPVKNNVLDFAYSFGVLHHLEKPKIGFLEIYRILKKNSPLFVYLYEDHSGNFIKYIIIKIIAGLRTVTVNIPAPVLYMSCIVFSPIVFIFFSLPAKLMKKFKYTRRFADKMPFNFGTTLFSLQADLFDRFSAPIEHRFNIQEVCDLFCNNGFCNVCVTKLKSSAGWVAWGYKIG